MGAELTQNEIFQMMGNYPEVPAAEPKPAGPGMSAEQQLEVLGRNISSCGIVRTAEYSAGYSDPYIRSALKLVSSGLDSDTVRSLLGTAAVAGDKTALKQQLLFNNRLLGLLFCNPGQGGKS